MARPAPSCKCRMAATIAAPSASFPSGAGQQPQRADGCGGGRSAPPGGKRLCRNRADRGGPDLLWRRPAGQRPRWGPWWKRCCGMVPELKRLRLSSIDSIEADPVLMRVIAEEERLMPHFHLSAQSGDDMILKRMKRRHTSADTIALLRRGAALSPRSGLRRRPDRGLSHRKRGDVRKQPEAGGRCRPLAACMSFLSAPPRHAGRRMPQLPRAHGEGTGCPAPRPKGAAALTARLESLTGAATWCWRNGRHRPHALLHAGRHLVRRAEPGTLLAAHHHRPQRRSSDRHVSRHEDIRRSPAAAHFLRPAEVRPGQDRPGRDPDQEETGCRHHCGTGRGPDPRRHGRRPRPPKLAQARGQEPL